jgi:hypothetical protein
MSRKSALKLSFPPDDYLAIWSLPSADGTSFEANGSLTVEAGKPPKGSAHGDIDGALRQEAPGVTAFPQYVEAPVLTGRLSNGANVLLINARVSYWFASQASIDAEAAIITLADVDNSNAALFCGLDVQVGGLDAIAGVAPIKSTKFPKNSVSGTWAAELDPKEFRQEWNDPLATVGLTYYGSFRSFDPYTFSMGFSPVAGVRLDQPASLSDLLGSWIQPLRRVVSIATGRPEEITYLTVYPAIDGDSERTGQLFGSGITQQPYESMRDEIDKIQSPLRLKSDGVSLLDLLRKWQELEAVHHPLLETYGSMLHARDQHPRSRFLLLLQAIEGTHGYETKASFEKRFRQHTKARDEVIELCEPALEPKQLKFLERNLSKRPPGGLEPAINWLANMLPEEVMERLGALPLIIATVEAGAKNAPDALRIIRNDLAHGTKGYDAFELHRVVAVLDLMVRAHALQLLGCPESVVTRLMAEK